MITDPIADMLTSIRNGSAALLPEVRVPHSKIKENVVRVLKQEGYIADYSVEDKPHKTIRLKLKYQARKGVIDSIRRASSPGLRRYCSASQMPQVLGGLGCVVVSTSRGIMTGAEARRMNVGGELICYVS